MSQPTYVYGCQRCNWERSTASRAYVERLHKDLVCSNCKGPLYSRVVEPPSGYGLLAIGAAIVFGSLL